MFAAIRNNFANRALKKLTRHSLILPSSLIKNLNEIKNVLIFYPYDKALNHDMDNILKDLAKYFPESDFTIIKTADIQKENLRFNGLAKDEVLSAYTKTYDLIIDFNPTFNINSTFILAKIQAALKLRFYTHTKTDSLYNLSICSTNSDLRNKCLNAFKYLDKLKESQIIA